MILNTFTFLEIGHSHELLQHVIRVIQFIYQVGLTFKKYEILCMAFTVQKRTTFNVRKIKLRDFQNVKFKSGHLSTIHILATFRRHLRYLPTHFYVYRYVLMKMELNSEKTVLIF